MATQAMHSLGRRDTVAERTLDGIIHVMGAVLSLIAVAILTVAIQARPSPNGVTIVAAAAYGTGLLAMIWCSAAYNVLTNARWKERLRPYDHAAIFLMIAGTYAPFALISLGDGAGYALMLAVSLAALAGVVLKLRWPRRYDRLAIVAYLAIGWAGLPEIERLISVLPPSTMLLLAAGGVLYTAGVAFHLSTWLRFHNGIWHAFVLAAATCHFLAVLDVVAG